MRAFCDRLRAFGNTCELHVFSEYGHLFTPAGTRDDGQPQPDAKTSAEARARIDRFLAQRGYL